MTLEAYLDEWLALARSQVQPTTWQGYRNVRRAYLRPRLGAHRVGKLTVRQLNLHFVELLTQGGRRGGPLKRRTVKGAHMVFRKALGDGVREGRLDHNIAARVTLPKLDPDRDLEPDTVRTWDTEQAARFLVLTADDPLHDVWRAALATGMRRGELLGLRWQDVNLTVPQLRVTTNLTYVDGHHFQLKSTKTGRGWVLTLYEDTAAAIGRRPKSSRDEWPVVFTRPGEMPLRPRFITDRWRGQWPGLDLPQPTFNQLGHCHACLLLDQGVISTRPGLSRTWSWAGSGS